MVKTKLTADLAIRKPVLVRFAERQLLTEGRRLMPKGPEHEDEQPKTKGQASTPQLDRLEKLANAAATAAQANSGGLARTVLTKKRSRRKSATSVTMRKPEREQRKRCGR